MISKFLANRYMPPAAGVTTYGADTFTRANGVIGTAETGGAWTPSATSGVWSVASNKASCAKVDNVHNSTTLAIAQANVTVTVDLTLSATNNRALAGIVMRYADANNWLRVSLGKYTSTNDLFIQQFLAGSLTTLSDITTMGLVNGNTYALKVVISGTTITAFVDGVQKASASFNAGLTTQTYGLTMFAAAANFDDGGSTFDNFLVVA